MITAREEWDRRKVVEALRLQQPDTVGEIAWRAGIGSTYVQAALAALIEAGTVAEIHGNPTRYALLTL